MEKVQGKGENCGGIYNACIAAAAVAGAAVTLSTAGWGAYLGVVLAGTGMEYCRQQASAVTHNKFSIKPHAVYESVWHY